MSFLGKDTTSSKSYWVRHGTVSSLWQLWFPFQVRVHTSHRNSNTGRYRLPVKLTYVCYMLCNAVTDIATVIATAAFVYWDSQFRQLAPWAPKPFSPEWTTTKFYDNLWHCVYPMFYEPTWSLLETFDGLPEVCSNCTLKHTCQVPEHCEMFHPQTTD